MIAAWSTIVLAPGTARAEDPEALRLFVEGRALAEQGKYAEACDLYAKSYQLESAPGTTLNLADCAEREGKLRRAWLLFEAAASGFDKTEKPGRAKYARERAEGVLPRLATLVLRIAEPGTAGLVVRIGDRNVPLAAETVERLDPGPIQITVTAPGREPFSTTADAAGGRELVVNVPALRATGAAAADVTAARRPEGPTAGRRERGRVRLALGLGGGGALALGVGGVLAWSARSLHNEQFRTGRCVDRPSPEPNECVPDGLAAVDRAKTRADIATGLGIGGGALLAAGAILYFTAPRERLTVAPVASPHAVGFAIGARF